MSNNRKLPHISYQQFDSWVLALDTPALDGKHDAYRTAAVLQYLGRPSHWPSWHSTGADAKTKFDATILQAIKRVDWSLYTDNFVYIPSDFYSYFDECVRREDPLAEKIRATPFAKMCAIAYALVSDVHPDRRGNLRPRIEAWSGESIDEHAPTMLGALFDAWSRHDAAEKLGTYGAVLSVLDPQASRSASVLSHLLLQMQAQTSGPTDAIAFNFDSSQ